MQAIRRAIRRLIGFRREYLQVLEERDRLAIELEITRTRLRIVERDLIDAKKQLRLYEPTMQVLREDRNAIEVELQHERDAKEVASQYLRDLVEKLEKQHPECLRDVLEAS